MLDLGVEPYLVASGVQVVMAQRLVRKLCPSCKKAVRPTTQQIEKMGGAGDVKRIYEPVGCPRCLGTGFSGRQCVFELLNMNDGLRDINKKPLFGNGGISQTSKCSLWQLNE